MKTIRVWMALSGLGLLAAQVSMASDVKLKSKPVGPGITVYVKKDNLLVADLGRAEQIAARVFVSIGIPVAFRFGAAPKSAAEGAFSIELQLDAKAPSQLHVGALAYAMPFGVSGTRIRVFCDRVNKASPDSGPETVLGYVMAHEIAHVLEGVSRHSEAGIMKAHWQRQDYRQMKSGTLPFDPTDVELILAALYQRAAPVSAGRAAATVTHTCQEVELFRFPTLTAGRSVYLSSGRISHSYKARDRMGSAALTKTRVLLPIA